MLKKKGSWNEVEKKKASKFTTGGKKRTQLERKFTKRSLSSRRVQKIRKNIPGPGTG